VATGLEIIDAAAYAAGATAVAAAVDDGLDAGGHAVGEDTPGESAGEGGTAGEGRRLGRRGRGGVWRASMGNISDYKAGGGAAGRVDHFEQLAHGGSDGGGGVGLDGGRASLNGSKNLFS
jgi:hypothetical protein